MKVYELMKQLSEMPAGAEVRISMTKTLQEMPAIGDGLRHIDFELQYIGEDDGEILLDGWCE